MTVANVVMNVGRKLALVVVMMLAAIGGWEVYKGSVTLTGNAHADGLFSHFACYNVGPVKDEELAPVRQRVTLVNQFSPAGQRVRVLRLELFCTPTQKVIEP
jgi:hypothetical protein